MLTILLFHVKFHATTTSIGSGPTEEAVMASTAAAKAAQAGRGVIGVHKVSPQASHFFSPLLPYLPSTSHPPLRPAKPLSK